jgi:hypothetical protein
MKAFLSPGQRRKVFLAWPMSSAEQSPNWPEKTSVLVDPKAGVLLISYITRFA